MIKLSVVKIMRSMHATYTRPLRSLKSLEQGSRSPNVSSCSPRFVLDRHSIHPPHAKVQAILEVRDQQNLSELQSFLGLVNY